MIDYANIIMTVVPPIVTGVFAYLIASRKKESEEKVVKAKADAETQTQALTIVRGVVNDMRDEFRRELLSVKDDNSRLNKKLEECNSDIDSFQDKLKSNDELIHALRSEIASLRLTIKEYEDEIFRLKKL